MKKLLIASTALVATAGMAAADGHTGVKLSGYAEMGVKDDGTTTRFHHDLDVTFALSGETDGGLSFGATIDLDEVAGSTDTVAIIDSNGDTLVVPIGGIGSESGPHSVYIKGGFGALTLGDTDGALDWAMTEVDMLTSIADDHTAHAGYNGNDFLDGSNDGQVLRYDNTFGGFGVALSYEMDDSATSNDVLGLGVKYSADLGAASISLGLGYQDNGTTDGFGISAKTSISGFDVVLNYMDAGTLGDHTAIGLGYTVGDVKLHANYGEYSAGGDGYGLAVNYDLGGGATVMAGYKDDSTNVSTWSLGLGLSF